jgi:prevent-host-death family protein
MKVTNIHEAKTHFSKLVERAAAGEEIVIGKAGKPLARLGPYCPAASPKRQPGSLKGKIKILPGFDEMDKEIEKWFSGNSG